MAKSFWFQKEGGTDAWQLALSEHRPLILRDKKPAFVTVLDSHSVPDEATWGREDYEKMAYSGPLYADWDGEKIRETISDFQKFLENLKEMGVNLHSLRLYATGGRGFHLEIPEPIFMDKVPKAGTRGLPYIYREMAMEMVVETLDMRVYTGRKGRMWRTIGVERSNGKFKVPISVEEAMEMTPELYDEVCSKCVDTEPQREDPVYNLALAVMFETAKTKLEDGIKKRPKTNVDLELLARHKGQFPPSVERIMRGEGLRNDASFHRVAMQLAITAVALGKSADDLVEGSEGLCKNHSGDSARYGSPRKRKDELRRMHGYVDGNPMYSYSRGGIRALVEIGTVTTDLDSPSVSSTTPEEDDSREAVAVGETIEVTDQETPAVSISEGLSVSPHGIYAKVENVEKQKGTVGFSHPHLLMDIEGGTVIGYEVNLYLDKVSKGRKMVTQDVFTSRASLNNFCMEHGGVFTGSDVQATIVTHLLGRRARKGGNVVYALHREGLDLVQNPLKKDRMEKDVVWVSPEKVLTYNEDAKYTYQSKYGGTTGDFKSDLHNGIQIENTPETLAWMKSLLNINGEQTLAPCLGWFVSCFHRQFYHVIEGQFPLLHPNGPAGCGKTLTMKLLARMHYLTVEPFERMAGSGSTVHSLKRALTASASIPLILDEYKPSEMGTQRTDLLHQLFRSAYNQGSGASGGLSNGAAKSSWRDVTELPYSTPIAFMAEAQEMQAAIVHRIIPVSFTRDEAVKHTPHFEAALAGQKYMGQLGRLILRYAFNETVESRRVAIKTIEKDLRASLSSKVHDRQVYNLAIALAGLDFLDKVTSTVFGDELKADIQRLRGSIYEHKDEMVEVVMSEAARVINDMSLMSRTEPEDSEHELKEGREYIVVNGSMELLVRESFVKYFSWCKRKGMTPLYTSADAFMGGLGKWTATVDKLCMSSPLKSSGQARVFRLNLEKMVGEGVEMFKTKS